MEYIAPKYMEESKMKTVKTISLVLALCLFVTLCFPATAEINAPTGTFSSDYFISYGVAIGDNGGHQLHIVFSTVGMGLCDEIGVATFSVEKLINVEGGGTAWTNISGSCPGQTGHNTASYSYSLNFQCASGGTYRVRATFVCVKTINGEIGTEFKTVTTGGYTIQ
jgi:hypothetical protein